MCGLTNKNRYSESGHVLGIPLSNNVNQVLVHVCCWFRAGSIANLLRTGYVFPWARESRQYITTYVCIYFPSNVGGNASGNARGNVRGNASGNASGIVGAILEVMLAAMLGKMLAAMLGAKLL